MSALFQAPLYPIVELLAKVSLVLTCGLLLGSMRRVDPALRHSILLASLCGALVLPLLAIAVPRWNAAILPSVGQVTPTRGEALAGRGGSGTRVPEAGSPSGAPVGASAAAGTPTGRDGSNRPIMRSLLLAIWALGTLLLLARLLIGRSRLRAIAARAWSPDDAPWNRLLEEEKLLAGVSRRVRLLVSPAAATPFTWGTREPVVLVPEDALEWSTERWRIVLRHELAHVARADSLAQSLAAIACAGYWFHPLALIAAKRLRTECESACDDRVVALGTQPWEYASHLLDLARARARDRIPGVAFRRDGPQVTAGRSPARRAACVSFTSDANAPGTGRRDRVAAGARDGGVGVPSGATRHASCRRRHRAREERRRTSGGEPCPRRVSNDTATGACSRGHSTGRRGHEYACGHRGCIGRHTGSRTCRRTCPQRRCPGARAPRERGDPPASGPHAAEERSRSARVEQG